MVVIGHQAATASQEPTCQLWGSICAKTLSQSQLSNDISRVPVFKAQIGVYTYMVVVVTARMGRARVLTVVRLRKLRLSFTELGTMSTPVLLAF